jgi:hypothetical protein
MKKGEEIKQDELKKPVEENTVLQEKLLEVIQDSVIEEKMEEIQTGKKRGRPKKEPVQSKIEEIKKPVVIPIAPLLSIIIQRLPNPIPLTSIESELINDAGNKLAEKYADNVKYLEEIQFSILLIGVLYPRIKTNKQETFHNDNNAEQNKTN